MTRPTLALGADTAGFLVFKLGAAGVAIGLVVGLSTSGAESDGQALQAWFAYSLAVAVAGAVIGIVAGFARPDSQPTDRHAIPQKSPAPSLSGPVTPTVLRPRISAFRPAPTTPKPATRAVN